MIFRNKKSTQFHIEQLQKIKKCYKQFYVNDLKRIEISKFLEKKHNINDSNRKPEWF